MEIFLVIFIIYYVAVTIWHLTYVIHDSDSQIFERTFIAFLIIIGSWLVFPIIFLSDKISFYFKKR